MQDYQPPLGVSEKSILSIKNVSFIYPENIQQSSPEFSLYNISLSLQQMSSTAVVGESGSGKTTLSKLALGLITPTYGSLEFEDQPLSTWLSSRKRIKQFRKLLQIIFQDPDASFNPKISVGDHLYEALQLHFPLLSSQEQTLRIEQVLHEVSLSPHLLPHYSFELSGGQKQRLIIARALLIEPKMLILDEPLSSLDASLRRSITVLLKKLRTSHAMTYLYITHDLSTVPNLTEQIIILYRGVIVEQGLVSSVFSQPIHPYTQLLLEAVPTPDPIREKSKKYIVLPDKMPPLHPTQGCIFAHRCPLATSFCTTNVPPLVAPLPEMPHHKVRCHYAEEFIAHPLFTT